MMRSISVLFLLAFVSFCNAQQESEVPFSENGWYLSPTGTIRILVLYAEIEYDKNPQKDPQANGSRHWVKGQLPTWKDDVFDTHASRSPKAMVSKYYHDISLGQYVVLGDYVDELLTIKESEHRSLHNLSKAAVIEANKLGRLSTSSKLSIQDFDMWKDTRKQGFPKEQGADDPYRYDHVMLIIRNSRLRHGAGSTDPGSSGKLFGYESDTQSRFGAMNGLPFEILKHEYNHLLLGGNNFHSGGGNAARFESFFTCQQGGWSMMGSANSSFLTMSGWDRYRLGWKANDSDHLIRAWDENGKQVNGDLDPMNGDTGIFYVNDLITQGDMIRIKIPYLPSNEYQQWLWIENHQGYYNNGSETDRYHWDNGKFPCIDRTIPGLYMQMQVDREKKRGGDIYRGTADYLRPVVANGNHDFTFTEEKMDRTCPFMNSSYYFDISKNSANPLSGNMEQELPIYDRNGDGRLDRGEHYVPYVRRTNGRPSAESVLFGRPEHAFTLRGNRKIGMGTNPSTANMSTLVRTGNRYKGSPYQAPNNRTTYLNGISIEIIDQPKDGPIKLRIRSDDTHISEDVRWASDSIVLPPIDGHKGYSLYLAEGKKILLNRSRTPTRNEDPDKFKGQNMWNDPTHFTMDSLAKVFLAKGSALHVSEGSTLTIRSGATLELGENSELKVSKDSKLVLEPGARLILHEGSDINCKGSTIDQGLELFQFCKGELVTQGDKSALECK